MDKSQSVSIGILSAKPDGWQLSSEQACQWAYAPEACHRNIWVLTRLMPLLGYRRIDYHFTGNVSFTDSIDLIKNGTFDILGSHTSALNGDRIADHYPYSYPFIFFHLFITIKDPNVFDSEHDYLYPFKPFNRSAWIGIGCGSFVMIAFYLAMQTFAKRGRTGTASDSHDGQRPSQLVAIGIVLLFVGSLIAFYQSKLRAQSTCSQVQHLPISSIETLAEAIKKREYTLLTESRRAYVNWLLKEAKSGSFLNLRESLKSNPIQVDEYSTHLCRRIVNARNDMKYAWIAPKQLILSLCGEYAESLIAIPHEAGVPYLAGFLISAKNERLHRKFNFAVHMNILHQEMAKFENMSPELRRQIAALAEYSHGEKCVLQSSSKRNLPAIGLERSAVAIGILAAGIIIALACLMIEILTVKLYPIIYSTHL